MRAPLQRSGGVPPSPALALATLVLLAPAALVLAARHHSLLIPLERSAVVCDEQQGQYYLHLQIQKRPGTDYLG